MNYLEKKAGEARQSGSATTVATSVANTPGLPKIFLDQPEVTAATTLSKTAIYEAMQQGSFPAPVRISARRVAWKASEVIAWCESRIKTDAHAVGTSA